MQKAFIIFAAPLLAISCASSPPVIAPDGPSVYSVSAQASWFKPSGGKLKADLYQQASQYCREKNRNVEIIKDGYTDRSGFTAASAELTFRCAVDDDPRFMR